MVVRSADSTTWTWNLVGNTVVREGGKVVARTALADGQQVFVGGPVVSGANDARLIVIRPASGNRRRHRRSGGSQQQQHRSAAAGRGSPARRATGLAVAIPTRKNEPGNS